MHNKTLKLIGIFYAAAGFIFILGSINLTGFSILESSSAKNIIIPAGGIFLVCGISLIWLSGIKDKLT